MLLLIFLLLLAAVQPKQCLFAALAVPQHGSSPMSACPELQLQGTHVLLCCVAALAHQNDFDVCWAKGSVAELIFTPLVLLPFSLLFYPAGHRTNLAHPLHTT